MLTLTTPPTDDTTALDGIAAQFDALRPRLVGVATRILGNRHEAEDIVQDAWVRWQMCDRTRVDNPTAFLVTTVTRLALNAAQTARARRERSVGTLPDPVDPRTDLAEGIERDALLDAGIRVLLQRLAPIERAAFVLRHAFDYPYARIADLLATSETNARQLVSRAAKHLADERRTVAAPDRRPLLSAFASAARYGEITALERVLVPVPATAA